MHQIIKEIHASITAFFHEKIKVRNQTFGN